MRKHVVLVSVNPQYLVTVPVGSPAVIGQAINNNGRFLAAGFMACVSQAMLYYIVTVKYSRIIDLYKSLNKCTVIVETCTNNRLSLYKII